MKIQSRHCARRAKPRSIKRMSLVVSLVLIVALVLVNMQQAHAAIALRGESVTALNTSATTTTLAFSAMPTGVVAGDLLLGVFSIYSSTATVSSLSVSGWAPLPANSSQVATNMSTFVYYKVATGSETAPTVTFSAAQKSAGMIVAFSGVDTSSTAAIFADNTVAPNATTTANTTLTTNAFSTASVSGQMIVALFGGYNTSSNTAITLSAVASSNPTMACATSCSSGGTNTKTAPLPYTGIEYGLLSTGATVTARTMTASSAMVSSGFAVSLKPAPVLTQSNYRWFNTSGTAGTVGSTLAAQNTTASVAPGVPVRLRMLVDTTNSSLLASTTALKLQYAYAASGTCSASLSFADVTTSTPVAYYNNAAAADGFNPLVASSGNDPTDGTTTVNQTYEEANPVPVQTVIPAGQSGMWDFSLVLGGSASTSGSYCMRAVRSTGTVLDTYSQWPALTALVTSNMTAQADSRVYQNADNIAPGSPLAANNTAPTLSSAGQAFRTRIGVATGFFKQVSDGDAHTCALASDNNVYCWGYNGFGQLGDNQACGTGNCLTPVAVKKDGFLSGKTVLSISSGQYHTCALASDKNVYCWGWNNYGQLGDNQSCGTTCKVSVAVNTAGALSGKTIVNISTGSQHNCAIASDNQDYCWGRNNYGQLGDNQACSTTQCNTPVAVNTTGVLSGKTIVNISTGPQHTCALASDNQAYCWGDNSYGQLGDNQSCGTTCKVPVAVNTAGALSGKTIVNISTGSQHTCAIASDNQAYCWGYNGYGQLGDNQACGTTQCYTPVAVSTNGVLAGQINRIIDSNRMSLLLQYALKTATTCRAQTGYATITSGTPIAYNDNPSVANAAAISTTANDPVTTNVTPQTYQDVAGTFTNPTAIPAGNVAMWDFSLKDNNATAGTSYCIRMAGGDSTAFTQYGAYVEVRIYSGAYTGPTMDQQLRGGQSVVEGQGKQSFTW